MGEQASGVNAERAFHRPSCRISWAQAAPCLATQRGEGADPVQRVSAVPRSSRPAGSPTKTEGPPANRGPQLCRGCWACWACWACWGCWGCWGCRGPLSLPLAGPLSALCACRPPEAAAQCRTEYILPQPPCTTALGQEGIMALMAARHATSSQSSQISQISQTRSALIHSLHAKLSSHVQSAPKRAAG